MFNFIRAKKYILSLLSGLVLIFFFQNCGKIDLTSQSFSSSFSSNLSMNLKPPSDYPWQRRYVFLIDMSYSMVSGPCPFDANVSETTHGFTSTYKDYDPNFPDEMINFADARARVADCSVDTSLNYGEMKLDYSRPYDSTYIPNHKTFKGSDFEGNRFKILKTWIAQMRNSYNPEFLERTEILIVPATGGVAFERLMNTFPLKDLKFTKLTDPKLDQGLNYLESIHTNTANQALLAPDIRFAQHDPDLENLKMGTTSLLFAYDKVYTSIDQEMEKLASNGTLTHSTFKFLHFGDNRTTPLKSQIDKSLSYFSNCVDCESSLEQAWGQKQDNDYETLDLKLSLLQGLTKYYGSGYYETEFYNMLSLPVPTEIKYYATSGSQTFTGNEYPLNQKDVIDYLHNNSVERQAPSKNYITNSAEPPYRITNNMSGVITYKATHVFILNSNFKVDANGQGLLDSDGDGLPDNTEVLYGFNHENARSNNICLDSLMTEQGYRSRCESLYSSKLCNRQLDSDGDALNECEELTIGTDPYDFDTDGDGAPDSLEILYGLNPLVDDSKSDTNADGISNLMNLGKGLNPVVLPNQVLPANQISILMDFIGQIKTYSQTLGNVKTDQFKLNLLNFPVKNSNLNPSAIYATYMIRPGSKGFNSSSQIPLKYQLIKPISVKSTNKLLGLIRIIDPDEPLRVYWEIFELDINAKINHTASTIDLSKFSQMKVIDRVGLNK